MYEIRLVIQDIERAYEAGILDDSLTFNEAETRILHPPDTWIKDMTYLCVHESNTGRRVMVAQTKILEDETIIRTFVNDDGIVTSDGKDYLQRGLKLVSRTAYDNYTHEQYLNMINKYVDPTPLKPIIFAELRNAVSEQIDPITDQLRLRLLAKEDALSEIHAYHRSQNQKSYQDRDADMDLLSAMVRVAQLISLPQLKFRFELFIGEIAEVKYGRKEKSRLAYLKAVMKSAKKRISFVEFVYSFMTHGSS